MNQTILSTASALVLTLGLAFSFSIDVSPLYGQQNQTSNLTSTQQGQGQNQTTGIGTAGEIENMTAGNIPVMGNETDIQSQNDTSVTEGNKNR